MTTKQIAEYVGRPERTVQDWVKALSAKSASISAKLASSSSRYPADYDLAETCLIIEEGMGKDVADVYRTNAAHVEAGKRSAKAKVSGALIDACTRAVKSKALSSADIRYLLGIPSNAERIQLEAPTEEKASIDIANEAIERLKRIASGGAGQGEFRL